MSATIITLGPQPSYSFNDMDDYSGGDGSRRDRRRAKRTERKEKRTAIRDARKSARGERKELRKENRGQRKELRQGIRQTRKDIRKGVKPQAEQAVAAAEQAVQAAQEALAVAQDEIQTQSQTESQDSQTQPQSETSQDQGGYSDDQSAGGYSDDQSGGGYSDDQGGYSDDQGGYGDEEGGYGDEEGGYGDEEGGYGDEEGGSEFDGDYDFDGDYNDFDGIQLEDYSEMSDSNSRKQAVKVNPAISDICNKIEWNKELCRKLEQSRERYGNMNNLTAKIQERKRRIQNLENTLQNYQENGLDYSSADGELVPSMRKSDGRPCPIKAREVREARIRAKRRRKNRNMTPVASNLNPQISKQRIVIPASYSNAAGTGMIALDDADDYDAEELDVKMSNANGETIELTSNTDGKTPSKINWTAIAIGVGIGAVSIYLMKRYKLI